MAEEVSAGEGEEVDKEILLESRPDKNYKYVILGCGTVGREVAKNLRSREEKFFIVDIDQDRVKSLREDGYEAFVSDMREMDTINQLGLNQLDAVLILSSDPVANEEASVSILKQFPNIPIIARAVDPVSERKLEETGVATVITPSKVISQAAIRFLDRAETGRQAQELNDLINDAEKFGIILHDNPDPDSIAGGLALKKLALINETEAELLYSGEITHQENRAMVNLLGIDLRKMPEEDLEEFIARYDLTAFVEHAISGENNPFRENFRPTIVIDHHPVDLDEVEADFIDIRIDAGSVCTIMTRYLQELDVSIDEKLASALLFGIRVDTDQFKRNTNTSDLSAAAYLNSLADKELLETLETPPMSPETLDVLGKAINSRRVEGSYLLSNVGYTGEKDALSQAADYLLQLEGISTVIVFAIIDSVIHISARNQDIRLNIGEVLQEAFSDVGSAGGHSSMGGGQIPIDIFGEIKDESTMVELVGQSITNKFLEAVGVE